MECHCEGSRCHSGMYEHINGGSQVILLMVQCFLREAVHRVKTTRYRVSQPLTVNCFIFWRCFFRFPKGHNDCNNAPNIFPKWCSKAKNKSPQKTKKSKTDETHHMFNTVWRLEFQLILGCFTRPTCSNNTDLMIGRRRWCSYISGRQTFIKDSLSILWDLSISLCLLDSI